MTRRLILILIIIFSVSFSFATHLRGGEITYEHISGLTYRFTVVTCNDPDGIDPESELRMDFGDGSEIATIPLVNSPGGGFKTAIYQVTHTFNGDGSYIISTSIENRNEDVLNIVNSGDQSACLETLLVINSFARPFNNSVYFENGVCPEVACAGQEYCFNPLAVDPDGDSLVYSLTDPKGYFSPGGNLEDCDYLNYSSPNAVGGGNLSIDPNTGTICWDSPQVAGEYVFVVRVDEYFKGIHMGYVIRDIQLTIDGTCINNPPVLDPIPDTCVIAGESFSLNVSATDPDGNSVSLFASGLPFIATNPATFNSSPGNPATGVFSWSTTCGDIPLSPYNYVVTIEAEDASSSPPLSDYETFYVRVIPPDIKNLSATIGGGKVTLNWDKISCDGALGYNVYRIGGTVAPNSSTCCLPGAANELGYSLIAQIDDDDILTYDDTDVVVGGEYCYVVTAFFPGEAESCPIETDCVVIPKDVPVITHVTVNATGDGVTGIDSIQWSNPTEIDQVFFPGPYEYRLYFNAGDVPATTLIYTTPTESVITDLDTTHVFTTDTESTINSFKVEMWDTGLNQLIGSTNNASSVFLSTSSADNQITLTWYENVPWKNTDYEIYRSDNFIGPFVLIGTSTVQTFVDQGLINGKEYCYYVKSIGGYPISSIISPIENLSQIKCDTPIDLTPPCPPELVIENDCENGINDLTWTNPNNYCSDDVTHYNIYYSSTKDGEMELIAEINDLNDLNANDTTFSFFNIDSVGGCFAVTALDSLKYGNESIMSDTVCVNYCPTYMLPNVFTPNINGGDGANDTFHPIYPYRHIDSVEFLVFNRWGQLIFETTDPDLGWDGKHKDNGLMVPDGTYYYTCKVHALDLEGLKVFANLHGHITLISEK